jgi:hypothetical protein
VHLCLSFYYSFILVITLRHHFYSCTCWVPTISVLNHAIFPYYSNLLLRRRGWTGIFWLGVLGYVLPWLPFLWCYGVFHCSVPLRVITVFRDAIYVIIIICYSWHLVICEHFWPYVWNNWSRVMHLISTWFWYQNRVWQFACVACFWSLPLGAEDFKNLQELNVQDFELQLAGEQGKWPLTILTLCAIFFSL